MPIDPKARDAELQDWAKREYLLSLVTNTTQGEDRKDVAQEAWCRVRARDPATIANIGALRSYGAKVVKHLEIDLLRGRGKVGWISLSQESIDEKFVRSDQFVESLEEKLEQQLEQQQTEERLYDALASLSPAHRQTLKLFHLQDLSAKEVAHRRGVKVRTVYSDTRDAIRKIRELFGVVGK